DISSLGIQHASGAFQIAHRLVCRNRHSDRLAKIVHPAQVICSKRLLDVLKLLPGTVLQDRTCRLEAPALIRIQTKRNLRPDCLPDCCDSLDIFLRPYPDFELDAAKACCHGGACAGNGILGGGCPHDRIYWNVSMWPDR